MSLIRTLTTLAIIIGPMSVQAEVPSESYKARIGVRDHSSSSNTYLRHAAQRIGQDRANYHRFGIRDQGDEGDSMFSSAQQRVWLTQKLAEYGAIPSHVKRAIESGTPMIRVDVYSHHVKVSLVSSNARRGPSASHRIANTGYNDPGLWLNSHPMSGSKARARGIHNFSNVCWMDTGSRIRHLSRSGSWTRVEVADAACGDRSRYAKAAGLHRQRTGRQLQCCWQGAVGWAFSKFLIRN